MAYTLPPLPPISSRPGPVQMQVAEPSQALVVEPAQAQATEPAPKPRTRTRKAAAEPEPTPAPAPGRTVRQASVRPRGGHPFYVPSQRKLLQPNIPTPLVLDRWVMNQVAHGTLEIVDA